MLKLKYWEHLFVTAKQEFTEITVVEGRVSVSTLFGSKILEAGNRLMIDYRQMTEKNQRMPTFLIGETIFDV